MSNDRTTEGFDIALNLGRLLLVRDGDLLDAKGKARVTEQIAYHLARAKKLARDFDHDRRSDG